MKFLTLSILLTLIDTLYADNVQSQLQKLQKQIDLLNKKIDTIQPSKGTIELKDNKTILTVGGRIQFVTTYASPEKSFFIKNVPLKTKGEDGLSMSVRDSRLWIKTKTPSSYGWIRSTLEIDFLGKPDATENTTNSYLPRLRHAYAEFDGFTIGQTNSAFNSDAPLDTLDYSFNYTFVRQPLLRYTIHHHNYAYDISFEQPETTLLDPTGTIITPKDDILPDLVLKARYYPSWGETSLALMGRYINQDNFNNSGIKDSAMSYSASYSVLLKTFELDDIRIDAQYGKGLGRYLAFNPYPAGSIDTNGHIKLQPTYGWHIGYRHWWSKKTKSTLGYSYSSTDNDLAHLNSSADKSQITSSASSLQANLFYSPLKNILTGAEYSYGIRKVESSQTGYLNVLNLIFRYSF